MAVSAGFIAFLKDQLAEFGPVSIRKMFGGAGVYSGKTMFGLIADDTLYLKADETTQRDFQAENLEPFVYRGKQGRAVAMTYWQAPSRCLDDPAELALWARRAFAAALSSPKPRTGTKAG